MPIDPVLAVVGDRASPDVYARVRDGARPRPAAVPSSSGTICQDCCTAISARSVLTPDPVLEDLLRVFPATLELATLATSSASSLGVPLGVLAAAHSGRWPTS